LVLKPNSNPKKAPHTRLFNNARNMKAKELPTSQNELSGALRAAKETPEIICNFPTCGSVSSLEPECDPSIIRVVPAENRSQHTVARTKLMVAVIVIIFRALLTL
jgi:hypothetical protein